jgi:SsrA-binding protein
MGIKIIATNKKASHDFFLTEKYEAGLVLQGTEVKSLREGKVSIKEAFIMLDKKGEAWAHNITIPQYEFGNINNHEETRKRKLLLHKKELIKIFHEAKAKALTIVATKIYFKNSNVKIEIALAKGKKLHDKRATEAKKDVEKKLRQQKFDI